MVNNEELSFMTILTKSWVNSMRDLRTVAAMTSGQRGSSLPNDSLQRLVSPSGCWPVFALHFAISHHSSPPTLSCTTPPPRPLAPWPVSSPFSSTSAAIFRPKLKAREPDPTFVPAHQGTRKPPISHRISILDSTGSPISSSPDPP